MADVKERQDYEDYLARFYAFYDDQPLDFGDYLIEAKRWREEYDELWEDPDENWDLIVELERLMAV